MASSVVLFICRSNYGRLLNAGNLRNLQAVGTSVNIGHRFSSELPVSDDQATDPSKTDTDDDCLELRDISRMPSKYRNRMLHVMIPPEKPDCITEMHQTKTYKRKLYAKFGKRSGIDPGVMWPTGEQLKEQIEFERDWEPSLQEMLQNIEEEDRLEAELKQQKRELVEKQMAKMPQIIDEYRAKLAKADAEERKQEAKRKALMDEARDFFGYDISPKDPRFEQMKLQKEEEEKKQKKLKKKEEKYARWLEATKKAQQQ